jgi:hypothetical protein
MDALQPLLSMLEPYRQYLSVERALLVLLVIMLLRNNQLTKRAQRETYLLNQRFTDYLNQGDKLR